MTVLHSITNRGSEEVLSIEDGIMNDLQDEVTVKVNDRAVFTMSYEDAVRMADGILRRCVPSKVSKSKRIQCTSCGNAVTVNNRVRVQNGCYICPSCKNAIPAISYPSYKGVI